MPARRITWILACLLTVSPLSVATAAPLEASACSTLKSERDTLIGAGAKTDMEKGAAWAKANLAPERLGKIERLITVEEQLSFRCGQLVTAQPILKEPPKPPATAGLSSIPLPKRKADVLKQSKKN